MPKIPGRKWIFGTPFDRVLGIDNAKPTHLGLTSMGLALNVSRAEHEVLQRADIAPKLIPIHIPVTAWQNLGMERRLVRFDEKLYGCSERVVPKL